MPVGRLRPKVTPLGRREHIRDAQDHGDWQRVASLLHQAHTHQEWLGCGLSSWTEYVQTLPMSRMHDWRLRRAAMLGLNQPCYTLREAMRLVSAMRTEQG